MTPSSAGWINGHTHLYSGLVPLGMPPPAVAPVDFPDRLEQVWWRLDRALDARSLRAAARYYVAHALLAGTTGLVDHHESPGCIEGSLDVLADACEELGMRALVCYGATERNGGRDEARRGLAECERFLAAERRQRVRGLVGLHASFTVSDATIREAGDLARAHGTVVHAHLAEDACDLRDARERGWPGPLERLLELEGLPRGSIVAHGVHLDRAQVERADAAGLWLVQNPRSNLANGVGYPRALSASERVALGTDGFPSDGAAEEQALLREARAHGDDRERAARRAGAAERLFAELFEDAPAARVDGAGGITIGDRELVRDAKLLGADLEVIEAEAREEARRLWARMEA